MNTTVTIRRATEADLRDVLRLYAQPDFDNGEALSFDAAAEKFRIFAEYPSYHLFIAEADGMAIGTFSLLIVDRIGHMGARSAIIEDVAVDPAHQGRGVGEAMMRFAMDEAGKAGCYKLVLSTNLRRERAHEFYKRLGFEQHGLSFHVRLDQEQI